jgi:hypothetical protein
MDSLRLDKCLITTGMAINAAKKVQSTMLRMRLCMFASSAQAAAGVHADHAQVEAGQSWKDAKGTVLAVVHTPAR